MTLTHAADWFDGGWCVKFFLNVKEGDDTGSGGTDIGQLPVIQS